MKALDYLSEDKKRAFSVWDPICFAKEGEQYVARVARHQLGGADLAIIQRGHDFYYKWFWDFSLKSYDNKPSDEMLKELAGMVCEERRVSDIRELDGNINTTIENAYV